MLDSASPQYQFVPVSLYVSMNVIYISSKFFVLQDLQLYDETQDEPCQARCNRCHRCHEPVVTASTRRAIGHEPTGRYDAVTTRYDAVNDAVPGARDLERALGRV